VTRALVAQGQLKGWPEEHINHRGQGPRKTLPKPDHQERRESIMPNKTSTRDRTVRPARRGRRLAACVCAAAAAFSISAGPAAAADLPLPNPVAPSGGFLDTDAKPVLDWSVPGRFAASWAAWDPVTATYNPDFVNPRAWSLILDGCASTSVRRITDYTFTLAQLGTAWTLARTTTACRLSLHDLLPAQGYYRATLTLHTDMGASPGVSQPVSRIVQIRDYLIVSIGDSLASGEGNPDVPGIYSLNDDYKGEISLNKVIRPAQWQDRRCHRSAKSGPSLAAKAFENRYTSVTFLSFACSGAAIRHLISDRYGGAEPIGSQTVPPQVDAVSALVGPGSPRGGRPIDALLISIGINEFDFAGIIKRCASTFSDCVSAGDSQQALDSLSGKYRALAETLSAELPATREVYLNDYPADVFYGGGCGELGQPVVGIDDVKASEISALGNALDSAIGKATHTFRGDYDRWNLVSFVNTAFGSHAYCARDPWFTTYEQSWEQQGNQQGTAHPNAAGHIAYANLLRRAMVPDQGRQPYRHLTVTINAVKAANGDPTFDRTVELTLFQDQGIDATVTRYLQVPQNGQWTPVQPNLGTFTLDVFPAPASPRHATALDMEFGHILGIWGTRSNGFDAGSHVTANSYGGLAVSYTVTADSPQTGPTRLGPHSPPTETPGVSPAIVQSPARGIR
jgi:hypothetical protein